MRVFRQWYKDRKGEKKQTRNWYVELTDHLARPQRFPAFEDKRQSELLGRQIERLVNYKVAGEQPDAQLTRWLEQIPDKLRSKLAKVGLLDAKRMAAVKPLSAHLEDFAQSILAKGATAQHGQQIKSRVRRVIEGCKFTYWTDISASKVERFVADLRSSEIGAQTSNYYLKDLKQFCKWMVQDGRASESPVAHLKTVRVFKSDLRHDRRALEPHEIGCLLEATLVAPERYYMTGYQRYWLYRLAIETGLRRNELRSLKRSSFDLEKATVTLEAAFSKNRQESILSLKPQTAAELGDFLKGKLPEARAFNKITNRTADMLKADLADAKIPYVDKAGRYLDFHSLRHTTGSLLAAAGVHPKVAQSIMRHSDINLTMSRYTHIFRGQESEAIGKLPDLSPTNKNRAQVATGTDGRSVLPSGLPKEHGQHNNSVDNNRQTSRAMGDKRPSPAPKTGLMA